MRGSQTVSFAMDDILRWEAEASVHETKASGLRKKADAARILLGVDASSAEAEDDDSVPVHGGKPNMRAAIAKIANDAKDPISKAKLREGLGALGFPKERISGNYFYLAIKKTEEKKEISVLPDGRIWRRK